MESRQEEVNYNEEDTNQDVNENPSSHLNNNTNDVDYDPSHHPLTGDGASPGKIFIGGLARETTSVQFIQHFGKYGEITDSVIMKDRRSGQPRGFGFITYADASVVDQVIEDSHVINGKKVEIKRTIPKGAVIPKDFKTKKIFVGGIPTSVDEDELKDFFSNFGEVKEHQIMRDHSSNRSRGFAFISFDSEETVDELLSKGNKIEFAGTKIEVKKAEPKKPNPPPSSTSKRHSGSRSSFGGGYNDTYGGGYGSGGYGSGGFGGGGGGPYRAYGARASGYGGYGGSEFGGYGGYGGGGMGGAYRGDMAYGYSGRYGAGFSRGYDMGSGYGGGPSSGYGPYGGGPGGGGYGGGYESAFGGGYGGSSGGSMYGGGGRAGLGGGSANGRYHPYGR